MASNRKLKQSIQAELAAAYPLVSVQTIIEHVGTLLASLDRVERHGQSRGNGLGVNQRRVLKALLRAGKTGIDRKSPIEGMSDDQFLKIFFSLRRRGLADYIDGNYRNNMTFTPEGDETICKMIMEGTA
jgi:hypothetical protein